LLESQTATVRLAISTIMRFTFASSRFGAEGQVVILDSGTTTPAIAKALRGARKLTIVINAVNIAADVAGSDVEGILNGGR
jgi:DeoR family transcriptional regulator, aga operon transcriptional repressor